MKVISLKMFLSYWIRRIDQWGKYPAMAMFSLYLIYFIFYKSEHLSIEITSWMVMTFLLSFLGLLFIIVFEIKKMPKTIYLLENEGNFDFNLINAKEGLLDKESQIEIKNKIKENFSLFASRKIAFYSIFTITLLVIIFPERHNNMKNTLFQTFNLLPPPKFNIEYSKTIIEGEYPEVKNLGEYLLWIRWQGDNLGNWKSLAPGETHSDLEIDKVDQLEVSLRYKKRTYYQEFPITTILKPKAGKIEITTLSPFKIKEIYRGQTEIKAYSNSQIFIEIVPIVNREFTKAILFSDKKILNTKYCLRGENLRLTLTYQGGKQTYVIKLYRSEDNVDGNSITLKVNEILNQPPIVTVEKPIGNVELNDPIDFEIIYSAKDDTSLKKLVLNLIKNKEKITKEVATFSTTTLLHQGKIILNLKEFGFLPGDKIFYYFQVWDFYGLTYSNQIQSIAYRSIYDTVQNANQRQSKLANNANDSVEVTKEIKREIEKMKISAEKGDVTKKTLESFSKKVENIREDLANKAKEVKSTIDKMRQDELSLSPSLIDKLQEIEKNLKSLDEEFLAKLTKSAKEIAQKANLSEKEILDFFKNIKTDELEKKLDEVLGATQQMKKMQKYSQLEHLANQIYEHHQDLVNQAKVTESVVEYNKKKTDVEKLLKELNQIWSKRSNFSDESNKIEAMNNKISSEELSNLQKNFKDFKALSSLDEGLDDFSDAFENLRKKMMVLNRQFQSMDLEAINEEIDRQILGLSFQSRWLNNLTEGKILDLKLTKEKLLKEKISLFVSEMESILKTSRRHLYELLIGYIPNIVPFFDNYDEILTAKKILKKKIDPASSRFKVSKNYLVLELKKQRKSYLLLAHRLIQLKNSLSQNQKDQMSEDQLNRAGKKQKRLNSRSQSMMGKGKLNEYQKNYLKQIAKEQNLISEMLENLKKQEGQGQKTLESKKAGEKSEKSKKIDKLVKEMSELEKDLENYQKGDIDKIVEKQKKIEEHFLTFEKGIRNKPSEKEKGDRSREIEKNPQSSQNDALLYSTTLKKVEENIRIKKYPPEYKDRILNYFNKLKLSLE